MSILGVDPALVGLEQPWTSSADDKSGQQHRAPSSAHTSNHTTVTTITTSPSLPLSTNHVYEAAFVRLLDAQRV
jgi:hypothetical protein